MIAGLKVSVVVSQSMVNSGSRSQSEGMSMSVARLLGDTNLTTIALQRAVRVFYRGIGVVVRSLV